MLELMSGSSGLLTHPIHKALTMFIDRPVTILKFIGMLFAILSTIKGIGLVFRHVKEEVVVYDKFIYEFFGGVFHVTSIARNPLFSERAAFTSQD